MGRFRDNTLSQLGGIGTNQACKEIQYLINTLPEISSIKRVLSIAKANMRRKTWRSLAPKEILQLVANKEPSNLDLDNHLSDISREIQQMTDEPKIDQSIHIINSKVNGGVGNIDTGKMPAIGKRFDWKFWLTIIISSIGVLGTLVSIAVNGVFTEEIKKFFHDRNTPPKVEKNIEIQKSKDTR
jgi:hypothetical protein